MSLFGNVSGGTTVNNNIGGPGQVGNTGNTGFPAGSTGGGLFGGNPGTGTTNNGGLFGGNTTNNSGSTGGGLFGGDGSNKRTFGGNSGTTNSGGLFGGNTANSGTVNSGNTGGLFGGANNTASNTASNTGGLFGGNTSNTANSNTNTNTGGLFGGITNSNSGGGLFGGNTNNSNANNTNTGGLFGGNTTNATSNTGANTGGLFGGSTNNTTSNTGGLFGGNTANTASNTASIGTNNTSNPNTLFNLDTKTSYEPINPKSTSRLLKDLLESANNLPKIENDLAPINLTLSELQRKSQDLIKNKSDKNNYTRAHYLLASSGVSAEEFENDLKTIEPETPQYQKVIEPKTTGIEQFLNLKKQENILNTIEQSLTVATKDFDDFISKNIKIDWKLKRNELRKSLLEPPKVEAIIPRKDSREISDKRTFTRDKFEKYATIIYHLNEARLNNEYYPLLNNLEEVNKSNSDLKSKQLTDIYKILIELTDELNVKVDQQHKYSHADELERNELIIERSKRYLQSQFFQYVEEIYYKDNQEFQPPNNINKVRFFIHKIVMKNDIKTLNINGIPIWCLIYYLLRCGLNDEALKYVLGNTEVFAKFDKNFPTYLKHYCKGTLTKDLTMKLTKEFNQQFSLAPNFDAYKYCVYKIIGKCDLSKKSLPNSVNLSMEDWLWFHLSIINESDNTELVFENYKLSNLQTQIIQLGPSKLNTSSNNPMYLKSLVLVGLYESAIHYSYEYLNEIDAVHVSIALNYYGLLNTSIEGELLSINNSQYSINFSKLIDNFTRSFKISDPKVASQYLILIALSNGGSSKPDISKCHDSLRELIILSREFNLIGFLNENGEKTSGILENQRHLINLSNLKDFQYQIIENCAKICEEEGRIFDSLLLYQLSQDYDQVLIMINKVLSDLVSSTELDTPLITSEDNVENNIILLSKHILNTFNNHSNILMKSNKSLKKSSDLLISILSIREDFINKKYHSLLFAIGDLELLPVNANDDLIKIRELAEYVQSNLDNHILKVIPPLLTITMASISQLNYQVLTKSFKSLNNEEEIKRLKVIAKNVMIFAGMIQYKMPRETYSLLAQLEGEL